MDAQTPRTDKAAHGFCQSNPQKTAMDMWDIECVDADFARELERELATARNDLLEEIAKEADKYPIGLTDFSRRIRAMKR